MKIKITRDIPGYKAGDIDKVWQNGAVHNNVYSYSADNLIRDGFAEETTDDIDIAAIRKQIDYFTNDYGSHITMKLMRDEYEFMKSYLFVKAVIDQLNGDFEEDAHGGHEIGYDYRQNEFISEKMSGLRFHITPFCKDEETAQRAIELVGPELKILFGVKR